jgi:hypothetical protein
LDLADYGAIDCDIHPELPELATLIPYLDPHWRDAIIMVQRGFGRLELNGYPPNAPLSGRPD